MAGNDIIWLIESVCVDPKSDPIKPRPLYTNTSCIPHSEILHRVLKHTLKVSYDELLGNVFISLVCKSWEINSLILIETNQYLFVKTISLLQPSLLQVTSLFSLLFIFRDW